MQDLGKDEIIIIIVIIIVSIVTILTIITIITIITAIIIFIVMIMSFRVSARGNVGASSRDIEGPLRGLIGVGTT